MLTKLQEIINYKKEELLFKKDKTTDQELEFQIDKQEKPRAFIKTLDKPNQLNLIAEIKKSSPSKGLIRNDFNPIELAENYKNGTASCLSVLTDEKYFQGHDKYIKMVKDKVNLPVLRKDFIIDPWQIRESRALGADCILLIMAALTIDEAKLLENEAYNYDMDVLVETHTYEEIIMANKLKTSLVGINNRNLKTMEVDINNTINLKKHIDTDKLIVAESGLKNHQDLIMLKENSVNIFLIGESLMKKPDVTSATKEILGVKN